MDWKLNAFGGEGPERAFGTFLAEVLLTAFVGVILLVTDHSHSSFAGLAIGSALTAVHLVSIPLPGRR